MPSVCLGWLWRDNSLKVIFKVKAGLLRLCSEKSKLICYPSESAGVFCKHFIRYALETWQIRSVGTFENSAIGTLWTHTEPSVWVHRIKSSNFHSLNAEMYNITKWCSDDSVKGLKESYNLLQTAFKQDCIGFIALYPNIFIVFRIKSPILCMFTLK